MYGMLIHLFIQYFLRMIKNKLVPRKGLGLQKLGNLIRECKNGNI
jgi:hypothetical protein